MTDQTLDDQIKILEEVRAGIEKQAKFFQWQENKDKADKQVEALVTVLEELRATREMLEAATHIFTKDVTMTRTADGWSLRKGFSDRSRHDSALDAWRDGVKGEKKWLIK